MESLPGNTPNQLMTQSRERLVSIVQTVQVKEQELNTLIKQREALISSVHQQEKEQ